MQGNDNKALLLAAGFQPMTLEVQPLFRQFEQLVPGALAATADFAAILAWDFYTHVYYKVIAEHFCMVADDEYHQSLMCSPPMGTMEKQSLRTAMDVLYELFDMDQKSFRIYEVKEWMLPLFTEAGIDLVVTLDEGLSDYIYSAADFAAAAESKDNRYRIRHFVRRYEPVVKDCQATEWPWVKKLITENWCEQHSCTACVYGCLRRAIGDFLRDGARTGLHCCTVCSQEQLLALFGYTMRGRELVFHIKEAAYIKGLSEFIHGQVMEQSRTSAESINYSEDMNREGLRRYKQHIAPYRLSHNYLAVWRRK